MKVVLAVIVSACALFGASAFLPDEAAAGKNVEYGIQDDAWLEWGPGRLKGRIAKLDRIGFDAVRINLYWYRMEPRPNRYRWGRSDRMIRGLRARGIRPIVTLWGTPRWANGRQLPNVAPTNPAFFQRFAQKVAKRYSKVDAWVMWNEPNKPTWLKPASPKTYVTKILNPGYAGIKSANRHAQVAGGVTGPRGGKGGISPVDFIARMKRFRAKLDVYAHHPYPVYPGDTPYKGGCLCKNLTMAELDRLLRIVNSAFPRARVWLTEYAYQTNPPDIFGVSPQLQARYIGESSRKVYEARKVDLLIHYIFRDEPRLAGWQSGLETNRGRPKPALAASMLPLAQVQRRGTRTTIWGQVRPGTGPQRYLVQRRIGGQWITLFGAMTTERGFLRRTVTAPRGAQIRLWYSAGRKGSPALTVR